MLRLDDLRSTKAKSGYVGVYPVPSSTRRPWQVLVWHPERHCTLFIGTFTSRPNAARAVLAAWRRLGKEAR